MFPAGPQQRGGAGRTYLAVSGWNGLGLVSTHVVIDAPLELLSNQSAVFPAALRVRQTLPLTQVVGVARGRLLVRMSCSTGSEMFTTTGTRCDDEKRAIASRRRTDDSLYQLILRVQVIH